jgi:hypothetical protein
MSCDVFRRPQTNLVGEVQPIEPTKDKEDDQDGEENDVAIRHESKLGG